MTSQSNLDSTSVITKIRGAEDLIKFGFYRIEAMEGQLQSKHLSAEERERIEKELEECKQELHKNQELLKVLQKENSKSFVVSAILLFLCFLVFGTYKMYEKHNEK